MESNDLELQSTENASFTNAQDMSSSADESDSASKSKSGINEFNVFNIISISNSNSVDTNVSSNPNSADKKSYFNNCYMDNKSDSQSKELRERGSSEIGLDSKIHRKDFLGLNLLNDDSIKIIQKKKKRKNKRNIILPAEVDGDKILMKYWVKRYRLFSKFDQGIKLDRGKIITHLSV